VEGEVVEPGSATFVGSLDQRRGLLEHDVGGAELVAHAVVPELELLITEGAEQPLPPWTSGADVGHPEFDVMEQTGAGRLGSHG